MVLIYTINTEKEVKSIQQMIQEFIINLSNSRLKKLERKHRSRLLDGRRILNTIVAELQNEVNHKILGEIENKYRLSPFLFLSIF
mgnify:CR=1 FL=1